MQIKIKIKINNANPKTIRLYKALQFCRISKSYFKPMSHGLGVGTCTYLGVRATNFLNLGKVNMAKSVQILDTGIGTLDTINNKTKYLIY